MSNLNTSRTNQIETQPKGMAPTAISNAASTGAVPDPTALKGKTINGGTDHHIIDPEVLTRPNIALWVTKDHK